MRHKLVHGYFFVDHEEVWRTAVEDLPDRVRDLEDALRD
jgi:uncharacterized protein with HEPN domain